jgi:hypothetical protein
MPPDDELGDTLAVVKRYVHHQQQPALVDPGLELLEFGVRDRRAGQARRPDAEQRPSSAATSIVTSCMLSPPVGTTPAESADETGQRAQSGADLRAVHHIGFLQNARLGMSSRSMSLRART